MNEAIKLAIENKWHPPIGWGELSDKFQDAVAISDPLFWQALGKALEWTKGLLSTAYEADDDKFQSFVSQRVDESKYHAYRYFDIKLTGGDETAFWKELLK